jgi:hypothetical protein
MEARAMTKTQKEIVRRLRNGGNLGPSDYGDSPILTGGGLHGEKVQRRVRIDTLTAMEDLGLIQQDSMGEWGLVG